MKYFYHDGRLLVPERDASASDLAEMIKLARQAAVDALNHTGEDHAKTIHLKDGRAAVMSTARLPSGEYETMLLGQDEDEIVSAKASNEEEAIATFRYFEKVYSAPELKGRYKKLAEDLKAAFAYGLEHQGTDDGGTSNFDAPTIHLQGWNRKKVETAAAAAGGCCSFWSLCGSYIFPVPGTGQGNTRTSAAEAARDYLEKLGYDTGMYYQMD